MLLPERNFAEEKRKRWFLYEFLRNKAEYEILMGAQLIDGKPMAERLNEELILKDIENIVFIGDPGSGKSALKSQTQKFLMYGPYRPYPEFRFHDFSYDPYSLQYTEGNEHPEVKKYLRYLMNKQLVHDYLELEHEANIHRREGVRTLVICEMPFKGRVNRGRDFVRHLARKERKSKGERKTLFIAVESVSSIYQIGGQSRNIILQEEDGYIMEAMLEAIGVYIPNFRAWDKEYLRRLKNKVTAMAREEQIFNTRRESAEEAARVLRKMTPEDLEKVVKEMEALKGLGEREEIMLKQQLVYVHQLLYDEKLYQLGYGLGLPKDSAMIVINQRVQHAVYDVLGELTQVD